MDGIHAVNQCFEEEGGRETIILLVKTVELNVILTFLRPFNLILLMPEKFEENILMGASDLFLISNPCVCNCDERAIIFGREIFDELIRSIRLLFNGRSRWCRG